MIDVSSFIIGVLVGIAGLLIISYAVYRIKGWDKEDGDNN